jgi:hypothetical protein
VDAPETQKRTGRICRVGPDAGPTPGLHVLREGDQDHAGVVRVQDVPSVGVVALGVPAGGAAEALRESLELMHRDLGLWIKAMA